MEEHIVEQPWTTSINSIEKLRNQQICLPGHIGHCDKRWHEQKVQRADRTAATRHCFQSQSEVVRMSQVSAVKVLSGTEWYCHVLTTSTESTSEPVFIPENVCSSISG